MPSPFPGMDPYLEDPALWPSVHHLLISEMMAELNRQLRPKYFANIEERVYLSDEDDPGRDYVIPDVHIVRHHASSSKGNASLPGSAAVIEPIDVTTLIEDEIHEPRIEIVDRQNRSVVTVIEILSPTSKLSGSYGRESYQSKRHEVMSSSSHLIEIDLLRAGIRIYIRERIAPYDYIVHVSRADGSIPRGTKAWAIPFGLPLPTIPVPLKGEDPDGRIDLQRLLETAYERGAFDLKIDYTREPVPALTAEQAEWARQLTAGAAKVGRNSP